MVARTTRRHFGLILARCASAIAQPLFTVFATNSSTEAFRIILCLTAFDDLSSPRSSNRYTVFLE